MKISTICVFALILYCLVKNFFDGIRYLHARCLYYSTRDIDVVLTTIAENTMDKRYEKRGHFKENTNYKNN